MNNFKYDLPRFSPCIVEGGVAGMMSNPKGSYVLYSDDASTPKASQQAAAVAAPSEQQANVLPPTRGTGSQLDASEGETLDQKAENALLWCYRRLKNSYGRLPFVEEAVAGLRERTAAAGSARQGGNTNTESCSAGAATTSEDARDAARHITKATAQAYMEEMLWAFIECAGNYPEISPDPRIWPHVMVYATTSDTERLDLLLNISGFHFEIIDQKQHLLDARGRIAGIGATKREAIDSAMRATQQEGE